MWLDERVVVMEMRSSNFYELDPVASRVWSYISDPIVVDNLCEMLAQEFDTLPSAIQSDVLTLVNDLNDKSLLDNAPD